jgi:hypothetical protein
VNSSTLLRNIIIGRSGCRLQTILIRLRPDLDHAALCQEFGRLLRRVELAYVVSLRRVIRRPFEHGEHLCSWIRRSAFVIFGFDIFGRVNLAQGAQSLQRRRARISAA